MNKILKITSVFLGAATLLPGCIEETFPEGGYATSDQIADSPFAMEGLITSMPTKMITNYLDAGDHFDFGYPGIVGALDRLAGELYPVAGNLPGGNQYYDRFQPWLYPAMSSGLSADGVGSYFFYQNYYQFIKSTNDAISAAGTNEANKEVVGVAKAFRAMFYLDMARLYDPLPAKAPNRASYETDLAKVAELTVPKVTESSTLDELKSNPRLTREEIFTFIFSDLDAAEAALADYVPAKKNIPSLAVVYGLKARAYLWLGGFDKTYDSFPTGEAAYRKAAEYARKAITASGCTMLTDAEWLDPKTGFNTVTSAWMWAMIQSTDTVLNNLLSWTAHMSPDAMWGYGYLAQPGMSVFMYDRMAQNDVRKKIVVGPERSYDAIKSYINLTEDEFATVAPYTCFKFRPAGGEKSNYSTGNVTSIPLMRVEEMYLIEAEATAHYDEATAKQLLTDFMSKRAPGYTVPAAYNLVDEIIFQKRVEFWGEGVVIYDLKRLNMGMTNGNPGTNAPSGAQVTTDGRAPWWNCVIPTSSVQQNTALTDKNNPDPSLTYDSVK